MKYKIEENRFEYGMADIVDDELVAWLKATPATALVRGLLKPCRAVLESQQSEEKQTLTLWHLLVHECLQFKPPPTPDAISTAFAGRIPTDGDPEGVPDTAILHFLKNADLREAADVANEAILAYGAKNLTAVAKTPWELFRWMMADYYSQMAANAVDDDDEEGKIH